MSRGVERCREVSRGVELDSLTAAVEAVELSRAVESCRDCRLDSTVEAVELSSFVDDCRYLLSSCRAGAQGSSDTPVLGDMVSWITSCSEVPMHPNCLPGVADMISGRGGASFKI